MSISGFAVNAVSKTVRIVVPLYAALFSIVLIAAMFGGGEGNILFPILGLIIPTVATGLMFIEGRVQMTAMIASGVALCALMVATYITDGVSGPLVFQILLLSLAFVIAIFITIDQWKKEAKLRVEDNRPPQGVMPGRLRKHEESVLRAGPVIGAIGLLTGYVFSPDLASGMFFMLPGALMVAISLWVGINTNWLIKIDDASPMTRRVTGVSFFVNSAGSLIIVLGIGLWILGKILPFIIGGILIIGVLAAAGKVKSMFEGSGYTGNTKPKQYPPKAYNPQTGEPHLPQ